MNSHQIRLQGSFSIPEALDIDTQYAIGVSADIVSISKESQEDGSYLFTYKAKSLIGQASDGKKVIKFKDNKKQSVKLRYQLEQIGMDRGLDPEKFYNDTMIDFRYYTLELLDFIQGLKKNDL